METPQPTTPSDQPMLPVTPPAPVLALPGARVLFKNGWNFTKSRLDLVAYLALPLAILAVGNPWMAEARTDLGLMTVVSMLVVLAALVFVFLNTGALLHAVHQPLTPQTPYQTNLTWARQNFWSLLFVYILNGIAVAVGFIFLIIPGIIIGTYLYFAPYVYFNEQLKGVAALKRSYALVKGRFWLVFSLFVKLIILFFVAALLIGIVVGIVVSIAAPGEVYEGMFTNVVSQVLMTPLTIIGVHAMREVYLALR